MQIGFDLRFAQRPGGAGVYTAQLFLALTEQFPRQPWLVFYDSHSSDQRCLLDRARGNLVRRDLITAAPIASRCLSLLHHLEFLAHRNRCRLYHYPHFDLPLTMSCPRLVLTIHDLYPLTLPGYCPGPQRAYFRLVARYNADRAAAVITISQYTRDTLIEQLNIPPAKIYVIPQGCSPAFRPLEDVDKLEVLRRQLKLPARFILYTGNHKPHKNLPRLLEAYRQLSRELRERFDLVLTGRGPETALLRQLACSLGLSDQVHFLGQVDEPDLPGLYNLADLLVLPSLCEGFGLPLVEALACGTPVACADRAAPPEVAAPVARCFDPDDPAQIAGAIADSLRHDVDNDEHRGACLAQARGFTWANTARLTYETYRSLSAT